MRHALLVVSVLLLNGCWSVPDRAWWPSNAPVVQPPATRSEMMVVEFDDAGAPFHADQFDRLHAWLEVASPDDPLLVFVHGWHHNAWYASERRMDGNLRSFRDFLALLEHRSGGQPVDAIYVGWRGDSMDTLIPWEASDVLSFVGRKRASVAVGRAGLGRLLGDLSTRHPHRKIVIVGHSFGGSAVLHAVRGWIEEGKEMPDSTEYVLINAAAHHAELQPVAAALQARALRPQELDSTDSAGLLARPHRKLLALQARGDFPVRRLYRWGTGHVAIGFDPQRITHHGGFCADCAPGPCDLPLGAGFIMTPAPPRTCDAYDEAVWVVLAEDGLSRSHNDIFNGTQAQILSEWIGRRLGLNLVR